jgi:hypothetical protein
MTSSPMDMVPHRSDRGDDAAPEEAGAGTHASRVRGEWSRPLRVMLALDGATACDTARVFLELAGGFAVVGTAPNGHRALALASEVEPDVVVIDADLPAGGLAVVPAVRRRSPGSAVVALGEPAELAHPAPVSGPGPGAGPGAADVYLDRAAPLLVLTEVLSDLAVRLDQENRRPLFQQWPAHVPLPLARWAESVRGTPPGAEAGAAKATTGPGRQGSRGARGRRRPTGRGSRGWAAPRAAAARAGSLLSAGAAAAATGSLPAPAQAVASRVLANLHLTVPNPEARHGAGADGTLRSGRHPSRPAPARAAGSPASSLPTIREAPSHGDSPVASTAPAAPAAADSGPVGPPVPGTGSLPPAVGSGPGQTPPGAPAGSPPGQAPTAPDARGPAAGSTGTGGSTGGSPGGATGGSTAGGYAGGPTAGTDVGRPAPATSGAGHPASSPTDGPPSSTAGRDANSSTRGQPRS